MVLNPQRFLDDVHKHEMIIKHDEDGVYRHLLFKEPGTNICSFSLVTWPGCLCFTGDMGTFVFTRTQDMFTFFRRTGSTVEEILTINPSYWKEKCEAVDSDDGITKYSPQIFRETLLRWRDEEASPELRQALEEQVFPFDENEFTARQAADQFEWEGQRIFTDFFETNLHEYTPRFLWCCYAIVWGIWMYDQFFESLQPSTTVTRLEV